MEESSVNKAIAKFDRRAKKRRPTMRMSGKGTKRLVAHIMKKAKQ